MSAATVMSWVSVVLSSLLFLGAAVAVAIMGRGKGRPLTVAGLVLGLLHNLSNVLIFPLLGHAAADDGFWIRYMTYNVVSTVVSFLTWGLIAAGIILMSRMVLRRRPTAPSYAPADAPVGGAWSGQGSVHPAPAPAWQPQQPSSGEPWGAQRPADPTMPVGDPRRHPGQGSGATSARYPGQ